MTSTEQTPRPDTEATRGKRSRGAPQLLAAAVLVVIVVGAVLLFGISRPPPLTRLADAPDPAPSAAVAWSVWRDGRSCVYVARPDATVGQVRCDTDGGELVGWTEDDRLLLARYDGNARVLEVDPATGDVLDTRAGDPDVERPLSPDGQAVTTYTEGEELVAELEGTELWRVEAPDSYGLRSSSVSPDGRFVAMIDAADRLLVMPVDGSAAPRIWAESVDSWTVPVWEGQVPDRAGGGT